MMNDRDYVVMLYDYYSELFNEKQKLYFEEYYFKNLSLGEISDNLNISRNAIHKCLRTMEDKLKFYEEKLQLYYKTKQIHDIINKSSDKTLKSKLKELI